MLNEPDYQCNHQRGAHARRAGGRGKDGEFVSAEAAAYPERLCDMLAEAFTVARSGGSVIPSMPIVVKESSKKAGVPLATEEPPGASLRDRLFKRRCGDDSVFGI